MSLTTPSAVTRRRATGLLLAAALPLAGCGRSAPSGGSGSPTPPAGSAAQSPSLPTTATATTSTAPTTAATAAATPSSDLAIAPDPGRPGPPIAVAARDVARRAVPVVCYHQIRDWRAGDSATSRSLTTPVSVFAAQMKLLAAQRWTPISPAEYYEALVGRGSLPSKPVLLTFDDGHGSQWNAVPVLRRHGFRATFFPMTVVLDKPNWLSRAQLRQLEPLGMTVGVHTYDHQAVTKYAGRDWAEQLARPKRELEQLVGHPIDWFAYPFGLWNRAALPHAADAGFRAAFQLAYEDLDPASPLLTLRRFLVDTTSVAGFERQLASFAART